MATPDLPLDLAFYTDLQLDRQRALVLRRLALMLAASTTELTDDTMQRRSVDRDLKRLKAQGLVAVVGCPPTHRATLYAPTHWGMLALRRYDDAFHN